MTTTTPTHVTQTVDGRMPGFGKLLGQALLGGALAAVVNLAIFFGGKAAGVPFAGEFQPGQMSELQVPFVAISSIVPGIVGALVALLFLKLTKAAARNFAILATVFAAVSLMGPLNVKGVATSTLVAMELMHVVAALGIGGALVRALKKS